MPETLSVHLNRDGPREVEPEAASLETDRSFVLEFVNHGNPLHVHVHLDDALAAVVEPTETQVYVDGGATRRVEMTMPADHPAVEGGLDLSTGYGAEETHVEVAVEQERKDGGPEVAVDETLGDKHATEEPVTTSLSEFGRPFALAGIVVVLVALVALIVSDAAALVVGLLGLFAGVAVALYVMYT